MIEPSSAARDVAAEPVPSPAHDMTPTADAALDRLARVVQRQLGVPVALVSIVQEERQVFPGLAGLGGWAGEDRQTPLSHSFCQHVVRRQGPLVVRDARRDPLVSTNLAIEDLGVVAYLGMPISGADGVVVGSLCAIDTSPRDWTAEEITALAELADICSAGLAERNPERAALATRRGGQRDERQLRALVDSLPAMVAYWDRDLRNVVANDAYLTWFGKSPSEIVGSHVRDLLGADLYRRNEPYMRAALAGERQDFSGTITTPEGVERDTTASYIPDIAADGSVPGFFVHVFDVSELTEAVRFRDAVLAASPDLIYLVDLRTSAVTWASGSFTELLGYAPEEITRFGDNVYAAAIHPDDLPVLVETNQAARDLADGEAIRTKIRVRHANGGHRWFLRRITPFERDADGVVVKVLALTRDIHESVELTEKLEAAAAHDALTGLPNRRLLTDRLTTALGRQSRSGRPLPVLYLDLDGFKRVNDTAGHLAGDAVLRATASRVTSLLRPQDTVARVGGDEFVVVLEPTPQTASGPLDLEQELDSARDVASRIRDAVAEPVHVDGRDHFITVSVGIALAFPDDDPDAVLRHADSAMYTAKANGKARWEVFDGSHQDHARDRAHVESTLREALRATSTGTAQGSSSAGPASPRLWVEYQPVFDLGSRALVGAEALARLHDEHGTIIPPSEFVPIAEETGLIGALGQRVLDTACRDLAAWHGLFPGHRRLGVSVNVSARQAAHADLLGDVERALAAHEVPPSTLTLELTESVLLEAGRSTMATLTSLRARGVHIAIDDFGTGYASLRYLAQLPVTCVKIDRSFTAGLPDDPMSVSIVRAVRGLARDLGIDCVIEGIETQEQLAGCPEGMLGQGYLLGRPMPEGSMRTLLAGTAVVPSPGERVPAPR